MQSRRTASQLHRPHVSATLLLDHPHASHGRRKARPSQSTCTTMYGSSAHSGAAMRLTQPPMRTAGSSPWPVHPRNRHRGEVEAQLPQRSIHASRECDFPLVMDHIATAGSSARGTEATRFIGSIKTGQLVFPRGRGSDGLWVHARVRRSGSSTRARKRHFERASDPNLFRRRSSAQAPLAVKLPPRESHTSTRRETGGREATNYELSPGSSARGRKQLEATSR